MAQRMNEQGLERDWGYLMRFLDKLEAQAVGMPPERRERLLTLLASKRRICDEIQDVLAGRGGSNGGNATPVASTDTSGFEPRAGLTVGTLLTGG